MTIPSKLKVGGHTIHVRFTNELPSDTDALFDSARNLISIDERLPQSQREARFIHELIHVMNPGLDADTMGHALLQALAEQLYQVLKDNRLLR